MTKKSNSKNKPKILDPVDIYLGGRLKQRRVLLGLSQTQMAKVLDITFQQIQKYEKGTNRIFASRLVDFSSILKVPITYFFDNMPANVLRQSPNSINNVVQEPQQAIKDNPMVKNEILILIRHYYKIKDANKRKSIIRLCETIGG